MKEDCYITIQLMADNEEIPMFQQVADGLIAHIRSGILRPLDKLPASRVLALKLGVSRKTIVKATEQLLLKGVLVSRERAGLFVAPTAMDIIKEGDSSRSVPVIAASPSAPPPTLLKVNDGFPDTRLLPFLEFTRAYRKLFNRAAQWKSLGYNSPVGYHKFRHAIATMLGHFRSLAVEDEELCIVRGSQMALYLTFHAVLRRGDHVAIESPGYGKAYEAMVAAGLVVHPVAVDADGIQVDQLEQICTTYALKAVYLTPNLQYPTTVRLSLARRQRIKQLVETYNFLVIEDDFGASFQFDSSRLPPLSAMLDKRHSIYIGTFSKIFAPAIRIGYVASSVETIGQIATYRCLVDIQGDTVQEHALYEMMDGGVISRHLRRSTKIYRERLDFVSKEIRRLLGDSVSYRRPHGGLALWLAFTGKTTAEAVREGMRQKGMEAPVFTLDDGTVGLRMGYASMTHEELSHAVQILASLVKTLPH